jgi:RNA polymerase sigma-70 factor (ECF subfamily)
MIAESGPQQAELVSVLVADARAGDEAAFSRIVVRYHPDLLRIALVVCADVDLAAEAAQSAWVVAWRRLADLRDPVNLRPWLMSIAANEARQLARSRGRRRVREVAVIDPAMPAADATVADRVDLANALATIDPRDRVLLGLRYLAGLDSTEIARVMGMSATGVRSRLARARERLRQELGDD